MPFPLALTDAQLDTLYRLSWPLARADRGPFLEAVAAKLAEMLRKPISVRSIHL